ncbi:MAG: hypothetical protein HY403_06060 [Elusimicrobia bacterium]|nr:hypothetical protein [Elusimicrobiota bacterium]
MAPELTVATEGTKLGKWEAQLASKAAAELSPSLVGKSPKVIVEELLTCLRNEKHERTSQNLNHWQEHAPRFLKSVVHVWREADRRDAFLRKSHGRAVSVALAVTSDPTLAEDAVSRTDIEFMTEKVRERYYFLAVKRNARDIMREVRREQEWLTSLEKARGSTGDAWAEFSDESMDDVQSADPAAGSLDGLDPLEAILRRQDQVKLMGDLARAKKKVETESKYRGVRRRKWWKELLSRDAKLAEKAVRNARLKRLVSAGSLCGQSGGQSLRNRGA